MAKALTVKGIAPEKSLEECARRIITTRMHEMMSFKEGAIDGRDIEYVHDMRVASRRLRAAMRNFADCFTPKKEFRRHLKRVEQITSTLGGVRDLDVLIDRFQKDVLTVPEDAQIGVQNLIDHLQKEREERRTLMFTMFEELDKRNFEQKFLKFFEV
ncbi:CHAD domain-containing protein [Candidatus Poribacteria bacterium]|nr:CHAD domain-containing protein [Candidatus Poribacteria bacterium]